MYRNYLLYQIFFELVPCKAVNIIKITVVVKVVLKLVVQLPQNSYRRKDKVFADYTGFSGNFRQAHKHLQVYDSTSSFHNVLGNNFRKS